jgi:hypothetical protein
MPARVAIFRSARRHRDIGTRIRNCMARIAATLEALLANLIDYAGLYPPAALPLTIASERYNGFLASPEAWMLNRLVLPAAKLPDLQLPAHWRVTLVVDAEPGPLPPQVETLETKQAHGFSLPTYCEAPVTQITGGFAKVRTGGLTPESIPDSSEVAGFLLEAAAARLPFKATAGLHHPIRGTYPLTYAADSPRAVMHGFLNVFVAAAFAWQDAPRERVHAIIEETDPTTFRFDADELQWRGASVTVAQIRSARRYFAHSFGSCSFEEPVSALHELGLLP